MIARQRVIFGDTDQMGVVYYANYLRYFEGARAEYLRSLGRSQGDLDAWGMALPVVEAHCAYHRPARYEDLLDIDIRIGRLRGASLTFVYEVRRGADTIASGWTEHACIDPRSGRPKRFPAPFLALIGGEV